jgi:hypothetical protein
VAVFCEYDNEASHSRKGGKFIDSLSDNLHSPEGLWSTVRFVCINNMAKVFLGNQPSLNTQHMVATSSLESFFTVRHVAVNQLFSYLDIHLGPSLLICTAIRTLSHRQAINRQTLVCRSVPQTLCLLLTRKAKIKKRIKELWPSFFINCCLYFITLPHGGTR